MRALSQKKLETWVKSNPEMSLKEILEEHDLYCCSYLADNPLLTPESFVRFLSSLEKEIKKYRKSNVC
tara:strand:- start:6 stop:209 length:204 start_codon:yes stop_codon:yes gene_type:complete